MASDFRKMATVRRVDAIEPIEGADRIEVSRVDGWRVITRKNEYAVGDLCVYLEIDTFCPVDVEPLAFLADRGTKTMMVDGKEIIGSVLKTVKLRGVLSQGLLIKPSEFGISDEEAAKLCDEEADVSERIGVWEYHRPVKENGSPKFILNPYDVSCAPVTNAERIQNCTKFWDVLQKVDAVCTIKVDGMSMTMVYDSRREKLRLFSHHREIDYNEPSIAQVCYKTAKKQGLVEFCERHPDITIQFELSGPNAQRGATKEPRCWVFAVWDRREMRKLTQDEMSGDEWESVSRSYVPQFINVSMRFNGKDFMTTVDDVLAWTDTLYGIVQNGRKDEGVVFHITGQGSATDEEWTALQHRLGPNMEVKAVSNRYLCNRGK